MDSNKFAPELKKLNELPREVSSILVPLAAIIKEGKRKHKLNPNKGKYTVKEFIMDLGPHSKILSINEKDENYVEKLDRIYKRLQSPKPTPPVDPKKILDKIIKRRTKVGTAIRG